MTMAENKAAAAKTEDEPVPAKRNTAGGASRKVLPVATLDVTRLKAMNADVVYSASDIRHVEVLPLDKGVQQSLPLRIGWRRIDHAD